MDKLGINKIDFVLVTHFHVDHYGSLEMIIETFEIDKVYMKEYSGLDYTNSDGDIATDEYRKKELNYFNYLKNLISKKSKYINIENIKSINLDDVSIQIFNNENLIKKAYFDNRYENFNKIKYNENVNSLVAYIEYLNKTILLTGDVLDKNDCVPYINKINLNIAKLINKKINIYKVPHHGEDNSNSTETLEIYKPDFAVITNSEYYVKKQTSTLKNLKRANHNVKILYTKDCNIVFTINNSSKINVIRTF